EPGLVNLLVDLFRGSVDDPADGILGLRRASEATCFELFLRQPPGEVAPGRDGMPGDLLCLKVDDGDFALVVLLDEAVSKERSRMQDRKGPVEDLRLVDVA